MCVHTHVGVSWGTGLMSRQIITGPQILIPSPQGLGRGDLMMGNGTQEGEKGAYGLFSKGHSRTTEEIIATHSSILAWKGPRTEESAGHSP